jgi:hypothetical protein
MKFTVTLSDDDAEMLLALVQTHPALTAHMTHRVALRVGLRSLTAKPGLLIGELNRLANERSSCEVAR